MAPFFHDFFLLVFSRGRGRAKIVCAGRRDGTAPHRKRVNDVGMDSSKPLPTPDEQYYAAHGPLEAALVRAVTAAAEARPASPIRFIAESLTNPERAAPTPRDDTKPFAEHAHAVESALAAAVKAAFMTRPEDPLAFVAGRLLGKEQRSKKVQILRWVGLPQVAWSG